MTTPITARQPALRKCLQKLRFLTFTYCIFLILSQIPVAGGQNATKTPDQLCTTPADRFEGNAQGELDVYVWMGRGICVRAEDDGLSCYKRLEKVLGNLNEIRKAEYGGAAGVLSLLPTIGALLGAPTNEIWKLMSIIPFGGGLAMMLSFGGAIMPVKVEDYEHVMNKKNIAIGSTISFRNLHMPGQGPQETTAEKLRQLVDRVRQRLDQRESARGYRRITLTALTENIVQLPFIETYKFYVSTVAYNISISGGESITEFFEKGEATDNVAVALRQLSTLKTANLAIHGSQQFTRSRNSVMIMVSVVGERRFGSFWRVLSKSVSIAVFVTGTAMFASVTLLSLPIAVLVLTLDLLAGIFGRAIAGWIVSRVSETEPMIHVISNTRQEAYRAVSEILSLRSDDGTPFQVEVNGHIFIKQRRVAKRSSWLVKILGVIAEPYDLRTAHNPMSLMAEAQSPFLGSDINMISMETKRRLAGVQTGSHGSTGSDLGSLKAGEQYKISRKPVETFTSVSLGD